MLPGASRIAASTVLPSHGKHPTAPWIAAALAVAMWIAGAAPMARATGRDFIDETLVAAGLGGREMGLELGADSRVDGDYRIQGWFTPELEVGITRAWLIEGVTSFVDRGRGLELGTWRAETRYVPFEEPRWPVGLGVSAEYQTELRAARRPFLERIVEARALVTRTSPGSVLATVNW